MNATLDNMKSKDQIIYPGKAAGRKREVILSEALEASTQAFLQKIPFKNGMQGLDLGCGTGEVTIHLKALVGAKGEMTGLDLDTTRINIAKDKAVQKNAGDIQFYHQDILEWKETQCYDFVYSRLFLNHLREPQAMLSQIYSSLKTGGFAMIEDLDISNYNCFPSCYAFDRYVELYTEIKQQQGADASIGNKLYTLFQQTNFKNINIQLVPPTFLNNRGRNIASLTLENIASSLLEQQLTTPTELQALLFELKSFEDQKHSLISLPAIYQICGYKF